MVIFTEIMKDMVLQAKGPTEVVVTEEQITIRISADKIEVAPMKNRKAPMKNRKAPLKNVRKLFTYNGESLSAKEWAARYNVSVRAIYQRFHASGTPETKVRHGLEKKTSKK